MRIQWSFFKRWEDNDRPVYRPLNASPSPPPHSSQVHCGEQPFPCWVAGASGSLRVWAVEPSDDIKYSVVPGLLSEQFTLNRQAGIVDAQSWGRVAWFSPGSSSTNNPKVETHQRHWSA